MVRSTPGRQWPRSSRALLPAAFKAGAPPPPQLLGWAGLRQGPQGFFSSRIQTRAAPACRDASRNKGVRGAPRLTALRAGRRPLELPCPRGLARLPDSPPLPDPANLVHPPRASPGPAPAPRRVGGAAGPRHRQDPRARTKECGEGARSRAGLRAAPAQAPPRALPGPARGPCAPPPPPPPHPRPRGPQEGGARRGGSQPELQSRSGSDTRSLGHY